MEYFELGDLCRCLAQIPSNVLEEQDARVVTFQILEGINFMHENQFAHRDLKPSVRLCSFAASSSLLTF